MRQSIIDCLIDSDLHPAPKANLIGPRRLFCILRKKVLCCLAVVLRLAIRKKLCLSKQIRFSILVILVTNSTVIWTVIWTVIKRSLDSLVPQTDELSVDSQWKHFIELLESRWKHLFSRIPQTVTIRYRLEVEFELSLISKSCLNCLNFKPSRWSRLDSSQLKSKFRILLGPVLNFDPVRILSGFLTAIGNGRAGSVGSLSVEHSDRFKLIKLNGQFL